MSSIDHCMMCLPRLANDLGLVLAPCFDFPSQTNQEVLTKHGCCMACNGFMGGCHPKLQTVLPERLCELLATHKPRATETGPPVNFLEAIQSSNTPIFSPGFEDSGALWLAIHRKNVSKAASLFQKSCLLR